MRKSPKPPTPHTGIEGEIENRQELGILKLHVYKDNQMSNLSSIERIKLERLLGMSDGYVLNFSNKTFSDFVIEHTGIDVYDQKYADIGESKAKRLRSFWNKESNHIVGKLLLAFLEFWHYLNTSNEFYQVTEEKLKLYEDCLKISVRLVSDAPIEETNVNIDVLFDEIQKSIIKEIELAKFIIWIAVAWFTDKQIFDKLLEKSSQGVNVQLIICDDDINRNSGLDYTKFETYKIPKIGKYENIMHNKFCVIDLNKVINGSYNWTNKAKYNFETVTTFSNRQEAEKFAEEFIKLKSLTF
ncbi:hypothetical protein F7734_48855 [Scytonema sp. UIC 10036]|uniref:phospholipase D-like domain-containing protein n=1 Tax=Scytonema sp. UIC 10036 TaxID=2304196 RepID=UPI0012DABAAC|nr:phospholipase D-like domain-containing protein [Scytonema sp. UIC 10036]MUG99769.1 hypothetical protein [Scytonema sp. UIC 10036]